MTAVEYTACGLSFLASLAWLSGSEVVGTSSVSPTSRTEAKVFTEPVVTVWIHTQYKLVLVPSLEKAMAPHSSTLAWKIPWMEGPGGLQSRTWLSEFTLSFHFHALEKEMATHSSVLAWRIPGTREPGGLLSMGSHRVGHDWSNLAAAAPYPPIPLGFSI